MKARPRIAYVLPSLRVGGTEVQLLHLLHGLAEEFEMAVLCTTTEGALIGDARRAGAHVRVLHGRGGWDPFQGKPLRRALRGFRPHIVHSFLSGFDYQTNRIAREIGTPVVISSRRELATWQKWRHRFMQRRANRYVDAIVANSRAVCDFAIRQEGGDPAKYHVIHNAVAPGEYRTRIPPERTRAAFRLPPYKHVVGMVANFTPVKDHRLFMDMAAELLKRRKDVHFLLVGAGPLVDSMGQLIRRRKHTDFFNRVATVTEIAAMYSIMEIVLLTSKIEGFPNAVMEAMAARRPVVASAVGGIPELIEHNKTGILMESRSPQAWADMVDGLLKDPQRRLEIGQAAAQWAEKTLTVEKLVGAHRNLYHDLLRRNASRED